MQLQQLKTVICTNIPVFRFGLRDSKRFMADVLRSSKGKGSKSARRKMADENEKENQPQRPLSTVMPPPSGKNMHYPVMSQYPVTSHYPAMTSQYPVNSEAKVTCQFLPPKSAGGALKNRSNNVPLKVYSKYT